MAKSAPSFQWYPEAWFGGTMAFTHEQKGIYADMLNYQWLHKRLPLDLKTIAHIVRTTVKKILSVIHKFIQDGDGYYNERLEKERLKQEAYRCRQQELATRRWGANPHAKASSLLVDGYMPVRQQSTVQSTENAVGKEGLGENPTLETVLTYAKSPHGGIAEDAAKAFWINFQGVGWIDAAHRKITDWKQALHKWATNQGNHGQRNNNSRGGNHSKSAGQAERDKNRQACEREGIKPKILN